MTCGACGQRRARRNCPALQQPICPVCCGSKRIVEIACPGSCAWLASAQQHPAAVVRRQHEADLRQLLATTGQMSEWQFQLFFLVQAALSRVTPDTGPLLDADVADAAGSLAATYETAASGVLYEHVPHGSVARRVTADLRGILDDLIARGGRRAEVDAAVVLRAIERGARPTGTGPTAYLDLVARILREGHGAAPSTDIPSDGGPLVVLP